MRPVLLSEVTVKRPPPQVAVVLRELLIHGSVSYDRLTDQLWGKNEDGGPLTTRSIFNQYAGWLRCHLIPELTVRSTWRGMDLGGYLPDRLEKHWTESKQEQRHRYAGEIFPIYGTNYARPTESRPAP